MTGPELWVRDGGNMQLENSAQAGLYYLRVTDLNREVTIRFIVAKDDLRSLRKWIKEALK